MVKRQLFRWRKTDESDDLQHCPEHISKGLYYARVYTVGQGYTHSDTNNRVLNLKIPPEAAENRQAHKTRAIEQFASELANWLNTAEGTGLLLVPMPPSKTEESPEHDDRIDRVANSVARRCDN